MNTSKCWEFVFDLPLKFRRHIFRATPRASSKIFLLLRLKRLAFDATELRFLYQSLFLSKPTYGFTEWGGFATKILQNITRFKGRRDVLRVLDTDPSQKVFDAQKLRKNNVVLLSQHLPRKPLENRKLSVCFTYWLLCVFQLIFSQSALFQAKFYVVHVCLFIFRNLRMFNHKFNDVHIPIFLCTFLKSKKNSAIFPCLDNQQAYFRIKRIFCFFSV